jgi:myo-inositol 2-dehydrogenase/D-chiro-inositol 1-dehydrogenase
MTPLRVALIGCGFIGRRHLENIAARTDVLLEATVDVREEAARAFCREFRGRYFTTRPEQVFEDSSIDAVLICTHHDSHTKFALDAAAYGKHVLVEKPMALTVEECRQIAAAADQAGITLTVNFKFRFAPAVLKVKEFIQSPLAIHGQLAMEKMPDGIWVRDPVRGGGLILATACHSLDMICWLSGSEPARVYAEGIPPLPEQGCNVTAVTATVRLANGAIASLLLAEAGENGYVAKWLHEVFGGDRSAVLYDHFRQVRFSGAPLSHFAAEDELHADGTFGVLEDFVDSIRAGRRPVTTAADGLRATRLAQAILKSVSSGQPQELQSDLD